MAWHIRRQCNWLSVFQVTLNKKQWSYHSTILKQFNTSGWNDGYSLLLSLNCHIFQQDKQLYKISSNNSCTSPSWTTALKTTLTSTKNRVSCRNIFKKLQILPLQSPYISLLLFVVNNSEKFKRFSTIHSTITRQSMDLHLPSSKLPIYQRGTYNMGIKVFNNLPLQTTEIAHDVEHLQKDLKSSLYLTSFYTLDEYFNYNDN